MADDVIRDIPSRYGTGTSLGERLNFERVSWGAIWAGVMVTIGLQALFLSFGIFIAAAFGGPVIWSMVWYLVTMGVSFYTGGWTAARLADVPVREVCALHGLATWGLAMLADVMISALFTWAIWARTTVVVVRPYTPYGTIWNGTTETWGGLVWGGIMLALIMAYFGGASAMPTRRTHIRTDIPATGPIHRPV